MTDEELLHRKEVRSAIERAIATGHSTYEKVLNTLGGADPALVKELYEYVKLTNQKTH